MRQHPEHKNILKARQLLDGQHRWDLANSIGQLEQSYEYVCKTLDELRKINSKGHEQAYKAGYRQGVWDSHNRG